MPTVFMLRFNWSFVSFKVYYDNVDVKQVDVSSMTGTFGILPGHVPIIAVLKPGLLSVYESDKDKVTKFFGK